LNLLGYSICMWHRSLPPDPQALLMIPELREKQNQLRNQIKIQPLAQPVRTIACCDSAFIGDFIFSVFVVFSFPELKELEVQYHYSKVEMQYVPGFLAFREIPNLLLAYQKLQHKPDVIMVDGHGIMHPRRMGIAAHLGIVLNVPTFGVAKKKLVGMFEPPAETKGSFSNLYHQKELLGVVLRSKDKVKPIFISPGHLCDVNSAFELTLQTLRRHKLPEPTRIADLYSKKLKVAAITSIKGESTSAKNS
jgi:deoxyribonuclease V